MMVRGNLMPQFFLQRLGDGQWVTLWAGSGVRIGDHGSSPERDCILHPTQCGLSTLRVFAGTLP